ncbi:MAG TPA: thiosulfate oxidation carrier protein SoxY, partial [Casimicrobiaceae bacterium]
MSRHDRHVRMTLPGRRRALQAAGALALGACLPARAADGALPALPAIPVMAAYLAGRTPRRERVRLELPRLADNGLAVPMRCVVSGPFAPGPFVRTIRLFSEINPVPDMVVFEFP